MKMHGILRIVAEVSMLATQKIHAGNDITSFSILIRAIWGYLTLTIYVQDANSIIVVDGLRQVNILLVRKSIGHKQQQKD
jgi:hypothetical protein